MPLTHTRTFNVRFHKCDAYGHLHNASYLRYMQETANDASASAGYDLERYASMPACEPIPKSPPPPEGIIQMIRRVDWNDIDTIQHDNNAVYTYYLTEVGFQAFAAFGWPFAHINEAGIAVYLRRLHLQYIQPAMLDDDLELRNWMSDVRNVSALRHYAIQRTNDQAAIARACTYCAWIGTDRQTKGRPVSIPKQILADIAPMVSTQDFQQLSNRRVFICPFQP